MTAKELMMMKPNLKLKDRFSGAEFTVSEITAILAKMIISRQYDDADEFANRFEVTE